MKDIKIFCKDHKQKIVFAGCIIGAAVVGALVCKSVIEKRLIDLSGKEIISWTPTKKFITLERAKELLDLNEHNPESLAIFKDGKTGMDNYTCILLSANVIKDKQI